jgi:hypothetical protein
MTKGEEQSALGHDGKFWGLVIGLTVELFNAGKR